MYGNYINKAYEFCYFIYFILLIDLIDLIEQTMQKSIQYKMPIIEGHNDIGYSIKSA